MSRRGRLIVVAAVALAAAFGVAIGVGLLSGGEGAVRPKGTPPFVLDLGVRGDPEAQSLRRAGQLLRVGHQVQAGKELGSHHSLQARIGQILVRWPDDGLAKLETLARDNPNSGAVLFHLGLARFWSGDRDGAVQSWRATQTRDPNTVYAIRASDLLFREFAPGLPTFIPSFRPDPSVSRLSPPSAQLAVLERRARRPDVRAKLLYGLALQRIDRPVSARKQYTGAARLAPRNPEALAADAVGRFDKTNPSAAFSRLGPLTRRYPRAATVRFHLGLLLLWLSRVDEARRQLRLAAQMHESPLSREAQRLLARLEGVRKPQ